MAVEALTVTERRYIDLRMSVGVAALDASTASVARRFGVSVNFVRYYHAKALDPTFHCDSWGGARAARACFTAEAQLIAETALWAELTADPARTLRQLCIALLDHWHIEVTAIWAWRVLHRWRWSFKNASSKAINKFSAENIQYYR